MSDVTMAPTADRAFLARLITNDAGEVWTHDELMTPTENVLSMVIVQLITTLNRTANGARVEAEYKRQLDRTFRFLETGKDLLPAQHRGAIFEWRS